ncbi:MAG: TlpA disulfide reductase family protein [Bacteroidota bacterium]
MKRSHFSRTYTVVSLCLLLWGLIACQQESGFRITANFQNCQLDSIGLYELNGFTTNALAKAAISESSVLLQGELPGKGMYLLGKPPNNLVAVVLDNGESVQLSGNCADLIRQHEITGSAAHEAFQSVNQRFITLEQQQNQFGQQLQIAARTQNIPQQQMAVNGMKERFQQRAAMVDSLDQANPFLAKLFRPRLVPLFDANDNPNGYQNEMDHYAQEFLKNVDLADPVYQRTPVIADNMQGFIQNLFANPDRFPTASAQAALDAVLDRMPQGSLLHRNALARTVQALDRIRSTAFLDYAPRYIEQYHPQGNALAYLQSRIPAFKQQIAREKKLAIGAMPPEISLPTPEGQEFQLSSLRGKVVLLDFWASWCKPCRRENPNVVRAYQKYKDKGFDILSISLDRSREPWLQAIEADNMSWHHVSDLKFWQSEAAKAYQVSSIPATFLLDREGKIVAKNLRGNALDAKLGELLSAS